MPTGNAHHDKRVGARPFLCSVLPLLGADHNYICVCSWVTAVTLRSGRYLQKTTRLIISSKIPLMQSGHSLFWEGARAPLTCLHSLKTFLCEDTSAWHDSWVMTAIGRTDPSAPKHNQPKQNTAPRPACKRTKNPFRLLAWSCRMTGDEGRYCLEKLTAALWFQNRSVCFYLDQIWRPTSF